ncbi:hypothetical protein LGM66_31130, partial [Burkholderia vietnamiensis]|nr:hypothetical protein [Burkholderia vietnamiensis]
MRHDLNSVKLIEPKFGPKLFAPLRAQVSWYCYEDTGLGIVDQVLSNNQAGLDRLSNDLPPANRASRSLVKFVFGEEDEHEEALYGTANHRVSEGSRGR